MISIPFKTELGHRYLLAARQLITSGVSTLLAGEQPSLSTLLRNSVVRRCLIACSLAIVAALGLSYFTADKSADVGSQAQTSATGFILPSLPTLAEAAYDYSLRFDDQQSLVDNFDVNQYTSHVTTYNAALNQIDGWATFIGEGINLPLSYETSNKLKIMYDQVQRVQQTALPILRDNYGPVARAEFANKQTAISAMTVGRGFKTVIFTGAEFKNQQAVNQFHATRYKTLLNLRFEKVIYKSRRSDRRPTVKTLSTEPDTLIVDWVANRNTGIRAVAHEFSTINHKARSKTTVANADTNQ